METDKDILARNNRRGGMTVPGGYFADFASRMAENLPEQEWEREAEDAPVRRSLWMKIRPYVYMAAMFAGVWTMMKMFDMMRPESASLSVEENPVLTAALSNDQFMNDLYLEEFDDYELLDEMIEEGTVEDFSPETLTEE